MFRDSENESAERSQWENPSQTVRNSLAQQARELQALNLEFDREIGEYQDLEKEHRSLLKNAAIGIYKTTPDGQFIDANPALAEIYGYDSPEQLMADITNIKEQIYVDPQQHQLFIELMYFQGYVSDFQSQIYCRDGSSIWISETARSVFDSENKLIYYEGFVSDITKLKSAEQSLRKLEVKHTSKIRLLKNIIKLFQKSQSQLLHSEKLSSLGQLLAGVAHEINNPVNFVCGNLNPATQYAEDLIFILQLYQKHYPDPVPEIAEAARSVDLDFVIEDFPKTLNSMKIGTERISHIVKSLRSFSRIDDEQMKPVNLHQDLDSTEIVLQSRLKATGERPSITVLKEYGNLPPAILCYGSLLNQVFMNLLVNAIDALEESWEKGQLAESPTIWIKTEVSEDNCVIIRIQDNGIGIPEEIKAKIFESFFTTKPTGKGTGLGLAICHEIVTEKHGGELTCISTPRVGTEFVVKIPMR
jgi:two-component system, NtrC family, sensor kinase